jgi:UDP-3-O-[3-hydroxymyristoyl] glucosamine N-acyltransferase
VVSLENAGPADLTFVASVAHLRVLHVTKAGAVLLPEALGSAQGGPRTRVLVPSLGEALTAAVEAFSPARAPRPG